MAIKKRLSKTETSKKEIYCSPRRRLKTYPCSDARSRQAFHEHLSSRSGLGFIMSPISARPILSRRGRTYSVVMN